MTEDQIYLLVCQGVLGYHVLWHGKNGWYEIGLISDKETNGEWPAKILDGSPDHYIDLYNVDVNDLLVVLKMNVDWNNPPKAAWANHG